MPKTEKFEVVVEKRGKGAWVPVPFDPNEAWGEKDRHHVSGSAAGLGFRGTVDEGPGGWGVGLGEACVRGVPIPGTPVPVVLTPEGPQIDELAADIREALATEPGASRLFSSLATFYRNGFIKPIEEAKRAETRASRIQSMVSALKAGRNER